MFLVIGGEIRKKKVRGPSKYLLQLKEVVEQGHGKITTWVENLEENNPTLDQSAPTLWPAQTNQIAREKELSLPI